ncbi:RsmD family RNA methyltransferase [Neglectibacter sp. CSJ-5]|uniref:RsmD family RNA methyltransferase n=1 Tax=Neglectibacter sp. CSJ-5 TaxID=3078043 RepID=UPI00292DE924|nr:RsmD family RNA methyltransferase [Neglectibacter sp. CSJ-5]
MRIVEYLFRNKYIDFLVDYWNDYRYNVKTCGAVHFRSSRVINFDYEPSSYSDLHKIFAEISFTKDSHLIDYGCGKGRVLIMAALYGCSRITGIELRPDLCQIAKTNVSNVWARNNTNVTIQILEQDAIQYKIDPSINYFFFYNPFHMKVFIYVLKNIQQSVLLSPRNVQLIFFKPQKSTIWQLEKMKFFTLQKELKESRCLIYHYSPNNE